MSGGYIFLHRSVFDHHLFNDTRFSEREAWIWLLTQASYQPHKLRYKNQIITLGRGEVPTSYRKLSEKWQWSVNTVRGFLAVLVQDGMISKKSDTGFLVITICNYDKYQNALINDDTEADTLPDTVTDTLADTLPDTNIIKANKVKKGKNRNISTPKNPKRITPEYSEDFENLLHAYPRKDGSKQEAFKSYQKAINEGIAHEQIAAGIKSFSNHVRREELEQKYIPHAATWFNQRRWESDYSASRGGQTGRDAAATAYDTAQLIIAKRNAAAGRSGRTEPANDASTASLCQSEDLRR